MKMKFARKRFLRKSFKLLGSLDKTQRNAKNKKLKMKKRAGKVKVILKIIKKYYMNPKNLSTIKFEKK
jgi:hypothetical protein